jgi:tetratricopeptide (TPR) repeat protein
MFLKEKKAALRQAVEAFTKVEQLGRFDGPLNLARAYLLEGQLDEASEALQRAATYKDPVAPPWVITRFSGMINRQQGKLEEAEQNFRQVLEYRTEETVRRKFDFSLDYEVINLLGQTIFDRAMEIYDPKRKDEKVAKLQEAVEVFQKTLAIDSENVDAHANLASLYATIGDTEKAATHRELHEKYRIDDVARGEAVSKARQKYPAADFAAEPLVIYDLQREPKPSSTAAKVDPTHQPVDGQLAGGED